MDKKIISGAFLALALIAATAGSAAKANALGLGVNAELRADAEEHMGTGGSFGRFVSSFRHELNAMRKQAHDAWLADKHMNKHGDDNDQDEDNDNDDDTTVSDSVSLAVVTDVDGDVIRADSYNGDVVTHWTIDTDSDTDFVIRGTHDDDEDIEDISARDRISVRGDFTDNDGSDRSIDADTVLRLDPAKAIVSGTITAVDSGDDEITVSTKHQGDVTVKIDDDTDFNGSNAFDDLVTGAKVYVTGAWNALKDLVVAAQVSIF